MNTNETKAQELIQRRVVLSLQAEIPDMSEYALAWAKLARDFDALGMEHNANLCRTQAEHYGQFTEGAYVRTLDVPFAALAPALHKTDETRGIYNANQAEK